VIEQVLGGDSARQEACEIQNGDAGEGLVHRI
jgi:hypothetical protein